MRAKRARNAASSRGPRLTSMRKTTALAAINAQVTVGGKRVGTAILRGNIGGHPPPPEIRCRSHSALTLAAMKAADRGRVARCKMLGAARPADLAEFGDGARHSWMRLWRS